MRIFALQLILSALRDDNSNSMLECVYVYPCFCMRVKMRSGTR